MLYDVYREKGGEIIRHTTDSTRIAGLLQALLATEDFTRITVKRSGDNGDSGRSDLGPHQAA